MRIPFLIASLFCCLGLKSSAQAVGPDPNWSFATAARESVNDNKTENQAGAGDNINVRTTQSVGAADAITDTTKAAYIRFAAWLADGFSDKAEQPPPASFDYSQYLADEKELFIELNALTNVDASLMSVVNNCEQASAQITAIREELQQLPNHGFLEEFGDLMVYLHTGQLGRIADELKSANSRDDQDKYLKVRFIQTQDHLNASRLMLPMIARKLAGTSGTAPISIKIHEAWGFAEPDHLVLVNNGDRDFHNCTVVVTLTGKYGETRRNIHFTKVWPSQQSLYAAYSSGVALLDQSVNRTTVTLIQDVEVVLYCDEVTSEPLTYKYGGLEKDNDINQCLDTNFKPHSGYQPYKKGIIFDDQRVVSFNFDGVQYLPKGTVTVCVKNGDNTATKDLDFSSWRAGDTKCVYFPDIAWDPTEWDAQFKFNGTSITRSYHWVR